MKRFIMLEITFVIRLGSGSTPIKMEDLLIRFDAPEGQQSLNFGSGAASATNYSVVYKIDGEGHQDGYLRTTGDVFAEMPKFNSVVRSLDFLHLRFGDGFVVDKLVDIVECRRNLYENLEKNLLDVSDGEFKYFRDVFVRSSSYCHFNSDSGKIISENDLNLYVMGMYCNSFNGDFAVLTYDSDFWMQKKFDGTELRESGWLEEFEVVRNPDILTRCMGVYGVPRRLFTKEFLN